MATFVKTDAGTWKAIIRKQGWPITSKTFRTKRDATDWARSTEDEMVRGVYISRAGAERLTVKDALQRYLKEVRFPRYFVFHQMGFTRPAFPDSALLPIVRGTVGVNGIQALNAAACDYRRLQCIRSWPSSCRHASHSDGRGTVHS